MPRKILNTFRAPNFLVSLILNTAKVGSVGRWLVAIVTRHQTHHYGRGFNSNDFITPLHSNVYNWTISLWSQIFSLCLVKIFSRN